MILNLLTMVIKENKMKLLFYFLLLLIISCSPTLEIPDIKTTSSLTFNIEPTTVKRMVIIGDTSPIDTQSIEIGNLTCKFDSLPFGTYDISVIADNYGVYSDIIYLNKNDLTEDVIMDTKPSQLNYINNYFINDLDPITISLKTRFPTNSLPSLIKIQPDIPLTFVTDIISNNTSQKIEICPHPYYLFQYDSATITLCDSVEDIYGKTLDNNYSFTIYMDSTAADNAIYKYYISSISSFYHFTSSNNRQFSITFKKEVIESTFINAFSITPNLPGAFNQDNWNTSKFEFKPADVAACNTVYTITIDTSLTFTDNSKLLQTFSWELYTDPLKLIQTASYPINGTTMAIKDSSFVLVFNAPIDSLSLQNGISINPSLDSIDISLTDSRDTAYIYHEILLSDTLYTLTLDSSITDRYGIALGKDIDITFSAE